MAISNLNNMMEEYMNEKVQCIFRPYITVKGRRIYRKNGGMFKIPIVNKKATPDQRK